MNRATLLCPVLLCPVLLVLAASAALGQDARKGEDLFNKKDLSNWTYTLRDSDLKMEDVWSVKDGILICKGKPSGYIRTKRDDYENYVLHVEWRFPEGTPGGNSGVLVHATDPGVLGVWPRSLEVQMNHGHAGDFWVIGTTIDVPDVETRRLDRRHLNLTDDSEKPIGEWNTMVITCKGDEVIVDVNGDRVNHAFKVSHTKGAICLQSEGAEVHFRKVRLEPLSAEKTSK